MKRSIIFYTVFLLCFDIFSYIFIDPNFIYLKPLYTGIFLQFRLITTLVYSTFLIVFFIYYWYFLKEIYNKRFTRKQLLHIISISVLILIFSYPAMISFDIFNYIATAKVAFFYHENPYLVMPIEFIGDPLLLFMHAANKVALYAPFWILISGIPFVLGMGNFLLTLFLFKCFIAACYVGTIYLLWLMTKNLLQTAFFALNPLVIIQILVSGHNDIVMMGLLLLSLYYLFKRKVGNTIFWLILSIGIKYATLILLPVYIFYFFKKFSKQRFFLIVTICMYCIFFLSSIREEIYPWYALWFLLPSAFLWKRNLVSVVGITFSFSLLLRDIPYMLFGTYLGPTPLLKTLLTYVPILIAVCAYMYITHKKTPAYWRQIMVTKLFSQSHR